VSDLSQKPLSADEIEAMLRARRDRDNLERGNSVRSDIVSAEPLGPGDVQHLRNTIQGDQVDSSDSISTETINNVAWPNRSTTTEELLRQAERQLEDALSLHSESLDSSVQPVPFVFPPISSEELTPLGIGSSATNPLGKTDSGIPIEVVGDIEMDVSLELGRAELTIEELLQLREGSVVPLNTDASDPIDILANGRLIARGEVVVINDQYGIRICEVIGARKK